MDKLHEYKSIIAENNKLLQGPVMINVKNKGSVKWVATYEKLDVVFANIKKSIKQKTDSCEIDKLMNSIIQHKFASQFPIFVKYYTNSHTSSYDINIGQCPRISKHIPRNVHEHDKGYFVNLILDCYINYYEWKVKMSKKTSHSITISPWMTKEGSDEQKKADEQNCSIKNVDEEKIIFDALDNREVPDSWDI